MIVVDSFAFRELRKSYNTIRSMYGYIRDNIASKVSHVVALCCKERVELCASHAHPHFYLHIL